MFCAEKRVSLYLLFITLITMNMKKVLIVLFLAFFVLLAKAQSRTVPIIPVDWKMIETEVKNHPEVVKALVDRMCLEKFDTTLTYKDRILAFYGQSYLSNDEEENDIRELYKLRNANKAMKSITLAQKILEKNPLNMDAINTMYQNIRKILNGNSKSQYTQRDLDLYANRMMRIMNTIAVTGDGSEKHPFYVTKVSDEYNFMRYYLDIWEYKMQMVTNEGCDMFQLKEKSKYYNQMELFFECTRVFELENLRVSNKSFPKKK